MTKEFANIPMRSVGPIKIVSQEVDALVSVPMATFETPLWPSASRGAKVSRLCGGINAVIIDDGMTRSVAVDASNVQHAYDLVTALKQRESEIADIVSKVSRFAKFKELHTQGSFDLVGQAAGALRPVKGHAER